MKFIRNERSGLVHDCKRTIVYRLVEWWEYRFCWCIVPSWVFLFFSNSLTGGSTRKGFQECREAFCKSFCMARSLQRYECVLISILEYLERIVTLRSIIHFSFFSLFSTFHLQTESQYAVSVNILIFALKWYTWC